jgi:hypothetical protein
VSTLRLDLVDEPTRFRPGDVVEGVVTWDLRQPPPHVEVSLAWHTEGRGSRDGSAVATVRFDDPPSQDARPFRLTLPASPFSCSGTLVSICWQVVATAGGAETAHAPFTMSPDGGEIVLPREPAVPDDEVADPTVRSA